MKIDKTIKGEKFRFYAYLIPNTMQAKVRLFHSDEFIIGEISDDFKYINLPDSFLSPYISDVGRVKVGRLKLSKQLQLEAKDYNQ
jgi:hypothetical protein